MEFVRLLGSYRESRAATQRVNRHPALPVELKAMTAWHMIEPAMSKFEIGRLEPERGNHGRNIQVAKRVARR
jgi:hypothetical protein